MQWPNPTHGSESYCPIVRQETEVYNKYLLQAIENKKNDQARALISVAGASPAKVDKQKWTSLHFAASVSCFFFKKMLYIF